MDPSAATPDAHVLPRWPVFLRYGDHEEVCLGDVYAESPAEVLTTIAGLLRHTADYLDDRSDAL